MNGANVLAALAIAAVMAATSGATSVPVQVDTSLSVNRHWQTVYTNVVALKWDWNAAATHAELKINGMNGAFATNFTSVVSNCLWRAFTSNVPSVEDVYDLQLTSYNGSGVVVGALTSKLAVVTGAFGRTAVNPSAASNAWAKVNGNVVIPYDAGWTESTAAATNSLLVIAKAGGTVQTNALPDSSGYTGWKLMNSGWGYGTFNLALSFPGMVGEWDAALSRAPAGVMVRVL